MMVGGGHMMRCWGCGCPWQLGPQVNGGVRKSTGKHFGSGREGSTMGTVLGEEEEEKWRYRGEKRGGGESIGKGKRIKEEGGEREGEEIASSPGPTQKIGRRAWSRSRPFENWNKASKLS